MGFCERCLSPVLGDSSYAPVEQPSETMLIAMPVES